MAMRSLVVVVAGAVGALLLSASAAHADDKPGKKPDANFDDLFGAPPAKGSGGVDAMKKATDGVGVKTSKDGLAAKVDAVDTDASVKLINAFAAETINQDKKLGCQPSGRDKIKIASWEFDDVPSRGKPFEVCLTMVSNAGREMNMHIAIVDARNGRVANAEDVVDFRGRTKLDHVLAYPAPLFKLAGQYFYVVDLDGKEVGRMPLFVVKVSEESKTSGVQGNAPPMKDTPVTAKEPDAK
jgi:hypothetical protein